MDPSNLAVRLGHRRRDLRDALSPVLTKPCRSGDPPGLWLLIAFAVRAAHRLVCAAFGSRSAAGVVRSIPRAATGRDPAAPVCRVWRAHRGVHTRHPVSVSRPRVRRVLDHQLDDARGVLHAERARVRGCPPRQRDDRSVAAPRRLVVGADPPQRSAVCETGSTALDHPITGGCHHRCLVPRFAVRASALSRALHGRSRVGAPQGSGSRSIRARGQADTDRRGVHAERGARCHEHPGSDGGDPGVSAG